MSTGPISKYVLCINFKVFELVKQEATNNKQIVLAWHAVVLWYGSFRREGLNLFRRTKSYYGTKLCQARPYATRHNIGDANPAYRAYQITLLVAEHEAF